MYHNFGFTDNVFNTKALSFSKEDFKKFTGRTKDIRSFSVDAYSQNRAVMLVTGRRGVGKTSFVNIMEYASSFEKAFFQSDIKVPNLIPCYHKVQIEPNEDIKNILLKSLSSILYSIKQFAEYKSIVSKIPKEITKLTDWVSYVIGTSRTAQLNLAGFGLGGGQTKQYRNISEVPTNVLSEKINQTMRDIKDIFGVDGVFLNINNVDILDEKFFCDVFNQLRDYLLDIDGIWNILIGYPGLYSSLHQQATRVAEIINGQETKLEPLSEDEVISILKKRRKIYAKEAKKPAPLPIEEDFIRLLYNNSDGEIRAILKACDDIVRFVFKENPNVKIINETQAKSSLKIILQQQLSLSNLKDKERDFLRAIANKGSLRPRDYTQLKLKSSVDFTNRARTLLSKNLLTKEVIGNVSNYKIAGVVKLARYSGIQI